MAEVKEARVADIKKKIMKESGIKIKNISMFEDETQSFIFNAVQDNDSFSDHYNEFWLIIY